MSDDFALAGPESTLDDAPSAGRGGASAMGKGGATAIGKGGATGGAPSGVGGSAATAVLDDGCSLKTYDAHRYVLCLFPDERDWVTYAEATTACIGLGAKLESKSGFGLTWIKSKAENDFLKTWIADTTPIASEVMVWSGANDLDEELSWVWGRGALSEHFFDQSSDGGGTPVGAAFDDFPAGKPNSASDWDEDCGGFDSELAWQWNDFKCDDPRLGYVCEERP